MNKSAFIGLIENRASVSERDLKALEELVANYPYCQLGHQFIAKAHFDDQNSRASDTLKQASIHALSRKVLRDLLESPANKTERTVPPINDSGTAKKKLENASETFKNKQETALEGKNTENQEPTTISKSETPKAELQEPKKAGKTSPSTSFESKTEPESVEAIAKHWNQVDSQKELSPYMLYKKQMEEEAAKVSESDTETEDKTSNDTPTDPKTSELRIVSPTQTETKADPTIHSPKNVETQSDTSNGKNQPLQLDKDRFEDDSIQDVDDLLSSPEKLETFRASELDQLKADFESIANFKKNKGKKKAKLKDSFSGKENTEDSESSKSTEGDDAKQETSASIDFVQPSNFDYLSEISNVKLDNLIPTQTGETGLEQEEVESNLELPLIPDHLGVQFGIYDSKFGEALYSSDILEEENNEELVLTSKESSLVVSESKIIDEFLKKSPKIRSVKDLSPQEEIKDLSKARSTKFGRPVTETMANIYLAQGNNKKAKAIFEKLILLFPEKKAYFAKKLREINE